MTERLSSIFTPFWKFAPFVLMAYTLLRVMGRAVLSVTINLEDVWFIGFALVWSAFWYLGTFRWKSVYLEDEGLRVSNYIKSIDIPLSNIKDVNGSSWLGWQPQTVTLTLYSPTEFGAKIVFVPRSIGSGVQKLVEEVRKAKSISS